jgi:hypothetical protein
LIQKTIEKMNAVGKDDIETWNECWFQTYKDLGGQSHNSGTKACPKHAAYGLWYLGRITNGGKAFRSWTIEKVNQELGKNAAYAVLALEILTREPEMIYFQSDLWSQVQRLYLQKIGEPAALSQQGQMTIILGLFTEKLIVANPG